MIPDRDAVAAFLRKLEQGIHRHGWDQSPLFAELQNRPGGLRALPLELPSGNPADFLAFAAGLVTEGTDPDAMQLLTDMTTESAFFGLALVAEGWRNDDMTPDQDRARKRALADTVGSYESRLVCAVDIRGNAYELLRKRGEKPRDWELFTGRVIQSLHAITLAIAQRLPPGLADLDALRRGDAIPSREELEARYRAAHPDP